MYSFSAARVHLDVGPSTEAWATTNGHTPKKTPPASLIINTQIVPQIRGGTFWAAFHTCGNFYCHLPPFRQFFISLEFTNLTRLACQWAIGNLLFLPAQCWESRVHSYSQHFYVGSCSQVHLLMLAKQMSYWHLHKLFKIVFWNANFSLENVAASNKNTLRKHLDRRKKFGWVWIVLI